MTGRRPTAHRRLRPWALVVGSLAAVLTVTLLATAWSGDDTAVQTTGGAASAGGIVVDGARVHLGTVPLNTTVEPTWTLRNTGPDPVALGEPHAEVVEGCCPGPLTVGATQLAPGESTTLRFPLQMHQGMDGPHDFAVHVPVATADGAQSVLTLGVDGFFGG